MQKKNQWVQDNNVTVSSTPVKIDSALQFVPKNTNPKEFKQLQQQIKENRRADKISAGPQSHILEGVTWDEAARLIAAEDAHATHTGDHVVLMGAASKGIIQRGYQHNATVYSAPYARNPFDHVTDREIDEYKKTVERKQRGESLQQQGSFQYNNQEWVMRPRYAFCYNTQRLVTVSRGPRLAFSENDTDLSESEAVSAAQVTSPASAVSETEEESRNEHRVLRIETTQAPIRSQPEVVLSDDPSDFLNAERAHADLTRDRNLLSDDEVFLDSGEPTTDHDGSVVIAAAVAASKQTERHPPVIVRQYAVAHRSVVGGGTELTRCKMATLEYSSLACANSAKNTIGSVTNGRTNNNYSRSPSFDNVLRFYESKEPTSPRIDTKCKLSLDFRGSETLIRASREVNNSGNTSSRSSLCSVPSIEWDAKFRPDFYFRTSSLPRSYKYGDRSHKLYRTRSHSGFINSYIGEPKPKHFHAPKSRSSSAEWTSEGKCSKIDRGPIVSSLYFSVDNIHQRCMEDSFGNKNNSFDIVKVKETFVPVYNVTIKGDSGENEFVESQEFTEDCYIDDVGANFSSDNQIVIDKSNGVPRERISDRIVIVGQEIANEITNKTDKHCKNICGGVVDVTDDTSLDLYKAECLMTEIENDNGKDYFVEDATLGEYLNFSGELDMEAVYENSVKELINKDIRDYSIPIKYYCDDYTNNHKPLSHRLQQKRVETIKNVNGLEPILEESKSSCTDESNSTNSLDANDKNIKTSNSNSAEDTNIASTIEHDVVNDNDDEILSKNIEHEIGLNTKESLKALGLEYNTNKNVGGPKKNSVSVQFEQYEIINNESLSKKSCLGPDIKTKSSLYCGAANRRKSDDSSTTFNSTSSFDSTSEYEHIEIVSDVISKLLDRISLENKNSDDAQATAADLSKVIDGQLSGNNVFKCEEKEKIFDYNQSVYGIEKHCTQIDDKTADVSGFIANDIIHFAIKNTIKTEDELKVETAYDFSMADLIDKIEDQSLTYHCYNLESSDVSSEQVDTEAVVVVEMILRYIIDQVYFIQGDKQKKNERKSKTVITVSECEDILFTAKSIWDHDHVSDDCGENNKTKVINDDVLNSNKVCPTYEIVGQIDCSKKLETNNVRIIKPETNLKMSSEINESMHLKSGVVSNVYLEHKNDACVCANYKKDEIDDDLSLKIKITPYVSGYDVITKCNDDSKTPPQICDEDVEISSFSSNIGSNKEISLLGKKLYKNIDTHVEGPEIEHIFDVDISSSKEKPIEMDFGLEILKRISYTDRKNIERLFGKPNIERDIDTGLLQESPSEKYTTDAQIYLKEDPSRSEFDEDNHFEAIFPESFSKLKCDIDILEKAFTEKCQMPIDVSIEEDEFTREMTPTVGEREFEKIHIEYESFDVNMSEKLERHQIPIDNSIEKDSLEMTRVNEDSLFVNELNMAFVEEKSVLYNNQSSPMKGDSNSKLSYHDISPIRRSTDIVSDLSNLYEKDDTILNSPFVKRAPVISMSQTVHKGGMKYWLSFDDSLNDFRDIDSFTEHRKSRRLQDNKVPSFFAIDRPKKRSKNCSFESEPETDDFAYNPKIVRRKAVLCEEFGTNFHIPKLELNDTYLTVSVSAKGDSNYDAYLTASASTKGDSDYDTCERSCDDGCTHFISRRRLLYDTARVCTLSRTARAKSLSWPPFEHTLFYRLLSEFRMSESFDPEDTLDHDWAAEI
ncbi:Protein hu-li tai shao [Eumeta japonica]|uniref:Protein hu-li tai shao n=1 Tax=Eumeta variegata TaxID=151549 RepID=A0A4C1WYU5_EUMVA|nr:Protein hu-li tai shao [Eumeta japonica]